MALHCLKRDSFTILNKICTQWVSKAKLLYIHVPNQEGTEDPELASRRQLFQIVEKGSCS